MAMCPFSTLRRAPTGYFPDGEHVSFASRERQRRWPRRRRPLTPTRRAGLCFHPKRVCVVFPRFCGESVTIGNMCLCGTVGPNRPFLLDHRNDARSTRKVKLARRLAQPRIRVCLFKVPSFVWLERKTKHGATTSGFGRFNKLQTQWRTRKQHEATYFWLPWEFKALEIAGNHTFV